LPSQTFSLSRSPLFGSDLRPPTSVLCPLSSALGQPKSAQVSPFNLTHHASSPLCLRASVVQNFFRASDSCRQPSALSGLCPPSSAPMAPSKRLTHDQFN
jgi:hypothetical protein